MQEHRLKKSGKFSVLSSRAIWFVGYSRLRFALEGERDYIKNWNQTAGKGNSMRNQPRFYLATNLLAGHSWKFMLVQSILSILLGVFFMIHYGSALIAFALLLGVMLLGCGVQGFVLMALNRRFKFGFALYSLFWFLAGIVLVSWPLASAASLLVALGIWFVIHSIELLTGALVDRIHTPGFRMLVALNGIVTLVFGVMIAAMPVALVGFVNFLFAFFLIFYGFVTLGVALRFRRITRSMEQDNPVPPDLGTE